LALADFEEALKKNASHADALCGRGQVRVLQGNVVEAVEDAEAALLHGKPQPALLCTAACIHARAALHKEPAGRGTLATRWSRTRRCESRAAELIEKALRVVVPTSSMVKGAREFRP
jgi:hypothetical protein